MTQNQTMQVNGLELRKTEEGWEYLSEGHGFDPDTWCDATSVLGPFGGSGVNTLLDELFDAKQELASDSADAAIRFALKDDEGMLFLDHWHKGNFDQIRREWKDVPAEVFIGADPLFKA